MGPQSVLRQFVLPAPAAALALCWGLAAAGTPPPLPDPLALEQALPLAAGHPRSGAAPELAARLPRRPTLHLECRQLALGTEHGQDPEAERPPELLLDPPAARQLEVLERFFDALLADLSFASDSEAMAVAYIQFDRATARAELGQTAPLRVLELETVYQEARHRRAASEIRQHLTRALLAQALGAPDRVPVGLRAPALPALPEPPPLDRLLERASAAPAFRALHDRYRGDDRALLGMALRQALLELRERLRGLASAGQSIRTEAAWRELRLDDSRTRYEQEFAADLGYSMSQQTRTRLLEQRLRFCQALAWAELNALTGAPVWPLITPED